MEKIKKKRLGLAHSVFAKTVAFILCILMLCVTAASVAGVVLMFNAEIYWTPIEYIREDVYDSYVNRSDYTVVHYYRMGSPERIDDYLERKNFAYVKAECGNQKFKAYEYGDPNAEGKTFTSIWVFSYDEATDTLDYYRSHEDALKDYAPENICKLTFVISKDVAVCDELFWMDLLVDILYALRFWIYAIGLGSLILAIACFIFLMCSAGRRRGVEGVTPTVLTKIPFEIPTAVFVLGSLFWYICVFDFLSGNDVTFAIGIIAWAIAAIIMSIFWCMSLALRIKLGTLFKNTIVFYVLRFIWRVLCFCGRCIRAFVRAIPMIWKAVLLIGAVVGIEFFVIILTWYNTEMYLFVWFIGKAIVLPAVIYLVITLDRIKRGAREIADGKIDYKVDTKYLVLDLKEHAEDLNRIGDGMNAAVEERLKSERMKTELITNVSHDIKTPLTSIINYSDLICREEFENENIKEYAEVLHNQSERMKRLLDDLVEASKASSGNIDIMLAECDARVMISQISGEYYQRLADAGLDLICTSPDDEIKIMADGRRLWRVLDNLMNNARKYALPGTRVYVSLEEVGGRAVFSFRNISRDPIAIKSDELSERFVRGDASRNTEGNGLGLSIAKSLAELQGGSFDVTVDGDLFKVTVSFATIK